MIAAELFVKCLENEGVTRIFGVPGEEHAHVMIALEDSSIEFTNLPKSLKAPFTLILTFKIINLLESGLILFILKSSSTGGVISTIFILCLPAIE